MARHTSPQRKHDEARFGVRIQIKVPPNGLGQQLDNAVRWLNAEVGPTNWAHWPGTFLHQGSVAFHFRGIEDAARFLAAFPGLEVVDGMPLRTRPTP